MRMWGRGWPLLALLCSVTCNAGDMQIRVGGFYAESDSSIDVTDPILGEDFKLDFESDLELDQYQFLPFFELEYAYGHKHHYYLDWKQLHRRGDTIGLSRGFQINIDDTIYQVDTGARLDTELDIDILRLGYGYDLFEGQNYTLGVTVGLHTMFISIALEGAIGACISGEIEGNQCGQTPIPRLVEHEVTAPLPDIGLIGRYQLMPGWELNGHAQYFYLELDDMKGALTDIRAGISAELNQNWNLSVSYNYYRVSVDMTETFYNIKVADFNINYSFIGPKLALTYRF